MRREITDANFEAEVLQSDLPVLVFFTLDSEYDRKMSSVLDKILPEYTTTLKAVFFKISENSDTDKKYGVSLAPTLLMFVNGKVVAQIVGAVDQEIVANKIKSVLETPAEELPELSLSDLKKAYKQSSGQWDHAFLSGIVSGVAFAIARSNLEGAIAFLVPAFAYGFFIANKNLGFSGLQKIVATGLMFIIGMYWREMLELMRQ